MSSSKSVLINVPEPIGETNGTGATDSNESSSFEASKIRQRRTSVHRETLERIHQDTAGGNRIRHVVPDGAAPPPPPESDYGAAQSDYGGAPERWVEKQLKGCTGCSQTSWKEAGYKLLPLAKMLSTYKWKSDLLADVLAGLTVGVMIIPQSMSYAKLAGLPVEYGLYSSLVPIYAYALFGSSRQLAVGPVALVSLLLSTGLNLAMEQKGMTPDNTENYAEIYQTMALQASFLVGVCNIIMGVLRMGFVTIFLSHAVISGFTSGAAIIIGLSQVKYIFGYSIPNSKALHTMLYSIFANIDQFNWKTFVLGTACIFTLMGMKKLAQTYPQFKWLKATGPLLVTVVTIVLQATIDLEARGIPIVGTIPQGFPSFTGAEIFPIEDLGGLSITVISIVIIGFMESIAIAKKLATKHNYELDSSQELFGLGMANLASGFFGGYPVTGSFSRSAVNNDSGAQSGISAMVTATMVALVLLFLTPVFQLLPTAVLASIVISGVISLVDYPEAIYLWKVHRFDLCVWLIAFLGTLFLGVELGLGISVGISMLLVIFESAYPNTAVLGRLPGTTHFRNIKQYPDAECYDGIVLVRIDAPIYFANTQNVREKIKKYEDRAEEALREKRLNMKKHSEDARDDGLPHALTVRFVILELSPVSHVDTSALHVIHEMNNSYKSRNIQLCLSNPSKLVMKRLVSSKLADEIGREHIFVALHDAVDHCLAEMDTFVMTELFGGSTQEDGESDGVHDIDRLMTDMEPASTPEAVARAANHMRNVTSQQLLAQPDNEDESESLASVHV